MCGAASREGSFSQRRFIFSEEVYLYGSGCLFRRRLMEEIGVEFFKIKLHFLYRGTVLLFRLDDDLTKNSKYIKQLRMKYDHTLLSNYQRIVVDC
jgi:hypothetical protein